MKDLQKISTPILDFVNGYASSGMSRFHMPGHKGHAPFGDAGLYALDTTELNCTDNLYQPAGAIAEAQALYAKAAGAGASLFLHNGSTAGIQAMLQLWAREGEMVILPRNAHLCAVNACILGGLRIHWIPCQSTADGYCYVQEAQVLQSLDDCPGAKALLLVRPDFYGGCIPLQHIAQKCHSLGIRLVVDEAHGAHLPWMGEPGSAGSYGADAWTQSVHKTLPGLTGSAVLHLRSLEDAPAALRLLRRTQTSSPSFLLLKSIDDAREWMETEGAKRLSALLPAAAAWRKQLRVAGCLDSHSLWRETGYSFDPTRLVVGAPQGGWPLQKALEASGIDVEMADSRRVVFYATAMDGTAQLDCWLSALKAVRQPSCPAPDSLLPLTALPPAPLTVRQAAMSACRLLSVRQAVGKTAACSAGLYPPGIPLVVPGEIVTAEIAEMFQNTSRELWFGLEGDQLLCVDA